jgi:molybdate transport system regulatory protein
MFADKPGWNLRVRIWVEQDGEKVLGPGRADLLELIDRHQSISAAAKRMDMSYRRAWSLVRAINTAAGETLVEAIKGGTGGGGASLTANGRKAVKAYRNLVARLTATANRTARAKSKRLAGRACRSLSIKSDIPVRTYR